MGRTGDGTAGGAVNAGAMKAGTPYEQMPSELHQMWYFDQQ